MLTENKTGETEQVIAGIIVKTQEKFFLAVLPPKMSLDKHEKDLVEVAERQKSQNFLPELRIEVFARFSGTLSEWKKKSEELKKEYALPGSCPNCSLF